MGPAGPAARERQHAAENPPADLHRLLHLLEIVEVHRRVHPAALQVRLNLLDERQHRSERVVHVVRHGSREVGHRVLPLGRQHPRLERLGARAGSGWRPRPESESDRRARHRTSVSRPGCRAATLRMPNMPSRATSGAHSIDASRSSASVWPAAVVVEQLGEPRHRLAGPLAARRRRADRSRGSRPTPARLKCRVDRQREADAVAPRLGPRDLLGDDAKRVLAALADQQRRRVIVVGQRTQAVEDLVEEILRVDLLHDLSGRCDRAPRASVRGP